MSTNSCNCVAYAYFNTLPNGCPVPVPTSPCSDEESCLRLANLFVAAEDSVGPCTEAGTVTFSTECFDYTGCTGNPEFRVYSISDPTLTVQSIDHTQMAFTALPGSEGKAISVVIEAWCGNLRAYGSVTIVVQNPCAACPAGFGCDPCDDYTCANLTGGEFDAPGGHATTTEVTGTETDPRAYSIVSYDDTVLDNVAVDASGVVTYTILCTENLPITTTVVVQLDASGAISTDDVVINIDLCDGVTCAACEFCNPCDGTCDPYPAKTVTITSISPSGLVENEAIDLAETITYDTICSGLLPAEAIFTYDVVECGVTETKTQTIEIACPAGCCDCPVLNQEASSTNCSHCCNYCCSSSGLVVGDVDCSGCSGCCGNCDQNSSQFTINGPSCPT